jgi:hypothetical protein
MRSVAVFLLTVGALLVAAASAAAFPNVTAPTTLRIVVGTHGVAGGPKKFTVRKGARIVLLIRSTIGEQVHIHGYDIDRPIRSPTTPVRMAFVARVAGVFEIELHLTESRGLRIGLLTVK